MFRRVTACVPHQWPATPARSCSCLHASAVFSTANACFQSSTPASSLPMGRVRPVLCYPQPILRERCVEVPDINNVAIRQVIADLLTTIVADGRGIGLAAPQIGESYRIFAVKKPLYRNEHELRQAQAKLRRGGSAFRKAAAEKAASRSEGFVVVVNPRITQASEGNELGLESCLSVPDTSALVRRASRIEVEYMDSAGQLVKEQLHGAPAVVFQHEFDHLDGLLLVDREVTITARPIEEEIELAQEKWYLDVMKYYGQDNLD